MSGDRKFDPRQQIADEIWEELSSLSGKDLDDYLASIGLKSQDLLIDYSEAAKVANNMTKRARIEEARRELQERRTFQSANVLQFDLSRKKQIATSIRDHADRTKDMTIAARNRTIEDENDLDVFLEACVRLGVIDDEGNLKG